jgi:hypothetical protein
MHGGRVLRIVGTLEKSGIKARIFEGWSEAKGEENFVNFLIPMTRAPTKTI